MLKFYLIFVLWASTSLNTLARGSSSGSQGAFRSESNKLQFILQGSQSSITLGGKSFSEVGIKPMVSFFPVRRLALFGSYYAVIKPDGSSNLNGLGFGGKFYLNGPGTSISLNSFNTTFSATPHFAYYLGMEFITRDLRSNSVNLNFTGFSYLAGLDWHFGYKWFGNLEGGYGNLKNALGSTNAQDLKIMSIGIALGVML